jgi:hypothetical protein
LPHNLLEPTWTNLDSEELRLFLQHRFGGGLGQIDGDDGKLYLPAARAQSRIALTFTGTKIGTVEPGMAFDATEWEGVRSDIEHSLLSGLPKVGRGYSFSSLPVEGSWRGIRSGVQVLPAPAGAPRYGGAQDPLILEFPINDGGLLFITYHRRRREHRKFTILLNLLLVGRTSCLLPRRQAFWASLPPEDGKPFPENFKWVTEGYDGPLDDIVLDKHSPPSDRTIEEVDPGHYYTKMVGNDQLRVPTDLDAQICGYLDLSPDHREKFDRALFWLDTSHRQSTVSVSTAFAALVSAIEALTERGDPHQFNCPICRKQTQHEERGATRRFKDFIDTYAPNVGTISKNKMYDLRSGIVHGSKLIEIDYALAFGWDPPWFDQRETHWELSTITRIALREWLKSHAASGIGSG